MNHKKKLYLEKKSPICCLWSLSMEHLPLRCQEKLHLKNVICLCCLLHLLANFSNILFAYRQTVWNQIRLLLKEQSDLDPHCLQQ